MVETVSLSRSNGMKCIVECFEDTLKSPPPIGSLITVKHKGCYTTGTLKKPIFWREQERLFHPLENEVVMESCNIGRFPRFGRTL